MHGCAVAVLAFPKHGCLAPELPVGSFLGVEIFLKDLPRSIDEFERFHVAALIRVLQKVVVAGDNGIQHLYAVFRFLAVEGDVDDFV